MPKNVSEDPVSERRRHFRVSVCAKVAQGDWAERAVGEASYELRLKHAELVDSLLKLRSQAQLILREPIDRGLEYLRILHEFTLAELDARLFVERQVSLSVPDREVSLSESGIGFTCEPPCEVGGDVWMVVIGLQDPTQRPVRARARLVRVQGQGDEAFCGYEFVDLEPGARRHLTSLVMAAQREEIRRRREGADR